MDKTYPYPIEIEGDRNKLSRSYKQIVSKNKYSNYPQTKKINNIRICVYNVNRFEFLFNANEKIYEFTKKINPDILSMIEYKNFPNDKFFFKTNCNFTFLQQSQDYGILTMTPLKADILKNKSISTNLFGENTGFTHCMIRGLNIITIHLDVFIESGRMRLHEILVIHDYIMNHTLQNVIIIGDFNEMNINELHPMYEEYRSEFEKRTGYTKLPTSTHDFLKKLKYIDVYSLFTEDDENYPKFSCWSGKLVDYCYIWLPTWDSDFKISDITLPMFQYSDHLPIVLDIQLPEIPNEDIYVATYLEDT